MTLFSRSADRNGQGRTLGIIALACLFVVACASDQDDGGTAKSRTVTLGIPADHPGFYGYLVADTLGFYDDEGINIQIEPLDGGLAVRQQIIAGNIDVGEISADATLAVAGEQDLCAFFTYFTQSFRDFVILEEGSVASAEDLRGATIGVSTLSGGEVSLVHYTLSKAGLSQDDFELVALGDEPATILNAFENDRIQAYASGKSTVIAIEEAGGLSFSSLLPEEVDAGPIEGLVAEGDLCEDKDTLARIGRASAKAIVFCQTNLDACLDVIRQDRPHLVEADTQSVMERFLDLTEPFEEDGEYVFGMVAPEAWDLYLEIFAQGEEPVVADPSAVDLSQLLVTDIQQEINDFNQEEVVQQAENYVP